MVKKTSYADFLAPALNALTCWRPWMKAVFLTRPSCRVTLTVIFCVCVCVCVWFIFHILIVDITTFYIGLLVNTLCILVIPFCKSRFFKKQVKISFSPPVSQKRTTKKKCLRYDSKWKQVPSTHPWLHYYLPPSQWFHLFFYCVILSLKWILFRLLKMLKMIDT